ncbi:MAG: glycosyltransferase [Pseudomonadota bacterium]
MPSLISILLPAYNAADTLDAALRSVQRQTYPTWECIVADDGSRDATSRIARYYARQDERFRLITLPHRGLVATLNRGLDACRGDAVARMDADDLMHRERLAEQGAALEHNPRWVGVGTQVRLFPRDGLKAGRRQYESWLNAINTPRALRADAFIECPLAHPTLMLRTRTIRQYRYLDRGWPEDHDLILRLLNDGLNLGTVPRRLLSWRDAPSRLSRTDLTYSQRQFIRCKAYYLTRFMLQSIRRPKVRTTSPDRFQYVLCGYGPTARALRRELARYGFETSHIVDVHPRRIGQSIDGRPVITYPELATLTNRFVIAAVAGSVPRRNIRRALDEMGFRERRDYVCAA